MVRWSKYVPKAGLFAGKIIATVFSLKIEFKENTQGLFACRSSKNAGASLNFDIYV